MSTVFLEVDVQLPRATFDLEVAGMWPRAAIGLFGPSGAGKTTLLEAIAGLTLGERGLIRVDGETWLDTTQKIRRPSHRRGVGYVPQEGLLFPDRSVRANLLAGAQRAKQRGVDVETMLEQVGKVLEIEPLFDRDPATLSAGERQRTALGRAICSAPRLLLLDEPLASLDRPLRQRVWPILQRVEQAFDIPLLLISHDPEEIRELTEYVVVLRAGRIEASGPTRDVMRGVR